MLQNKHIIDDKIIKEFVIKIQCKYTILFGSITALLGILLSIFYFNKKNLFTLGVYLSLSLLNLFMVLIYPIYSIKYLKKHSQKLHNNQTYETIINFGDKIYINEGSFSISFEYSQITKFYKLKNCYVLIAASKFPIIVSPTSFLNGSLDDFLNILKEKCPNLKKVSCLLFFSNKKDNQ